MFSNPDAEILRETLNGFDVPMFAVERQNHDNNFHLICINAAHEAVSGLDHTEIAGQNVFNLLPHAQAIQVEARYRDCANRRENIRYREVLSVAKGDLLWDTSLEPILVNGQCNRVLGRAVVLPTSTTISLSQSGLDDIQYYASQAALQLGQIENFLQYAQEDHGMSPDRRAYFSAVTGLCRATAQHIGEVRDVVDDQIRQLRNDAAHLNSPRSCGTELQKSLIHICSDDKPH